MMLDSIFFYFFAVMILGSALACITRRNVVYAAVWLINTLVGVAGIFLLLGAEFLAGVQVVVYIGGITVLFLFVIMLVPVREEALQRRFASQKWIAFISCALLVALLAIVISQGVSTFDVAEARIPAGPGDITQNSQEVGFTLFNEYLLPFELASILLLVAIVGAVTMSKTGAEGEG